MKLTQRQLEKMVKEGLRHFLSEQRPPSEDEITGAYAQGLAGSTPPGGERRKIDRLDEPESPAMTHVMGQIENKIYVTDTLDELFDNLGVFNTMGSEQIKIIRAGTLNELNKFLENLNTKQTRDNIFDGSLSTWKDFRDLIERSTPVTRLGSSSKNDVQSNRILRLFLKITMDSAASVGETEDGKYGVGDLGSGGLGFKDVSENKTMKITKSQLKKMIKEEVKKFGRYAETP